jgi:hypothetical protein
MLLALPLELFLPAEGILRNAEPGQANTMPFARWFNVM